jgi:hypothetical protein
MSPAGIPNGDDGIWTVTPALVAEATYHWHARGTDNLGLSGPWSASRSLTIDSYVTIGLDTSSHNLGTVLDATGYASSIATVDSSDPDGYQLLATDESDTWGSDCVCGGTIADWTGDNTTPTAWSLATAAYSGITVRDTTGISTNRLAKWGTANAAGWPEADVANNFYAGLENTISTTLHDTATSTSGAGDTVTFTWRVRTTPTTQAGAYESTVTLTAVGKP